MRYLTIA
jgi:phosphopantetheinyl transferase (holo-ACP synthase)